MKENLISLVSTHKGPTAGLESPPLKLQIDLLYLLPCWLDGLA